MADKIRLLIADDEAEFLDTISERLEMRDFLVTKASDGNAAITAARNNKFDLALIDLKMPGMDGQEVMKILKKEHKYVEIIILTGYGSVESAVECTKIGAYDFLQKPYNFEKLLTVLKSAYETRMKKKFENDKGRQDKIFKICMGESPLGILKELKQLDDDEK
jgi:DNA-binding NtrC family response regulator